MLSALTALCCTQGADAQRSVQTLKDNWQFMKGESFDPAKAQTVSVPHDWAIYGPFDRNNDLQVVAVEQNGEKEATEKAGRTGGLPFIGKGVYRTTFEVPDTAGKSLTLIFDGVMSNAKVKLNGKEVTEWPYGYNSFYVNLDGDVLPGENVLEVSCENKEASRAGIRARAFIEMCILSPLIRCISPLGAHMSPLRWCRPNMPQ